MEEVAEQLLNAYTDLSDDWRRSRRRDDFLQMMATDGCFLLEVMRADAGTNLKDYDANDPIFSVHGQLYATPYIRNDVLMIENQLPLLALERIVAFELSARTIKVTNIFVSAKADIDNKVQQFLSLCGGIEYFETRWESETSQVAFAYYVIYKERHGADIALLLPGASISDVSVNITPVEGYELPGPDASSRAEELISPRTPSEGPVKKAVEVVREMMDNGFVLSEDAMKRARSFDNRDRHQLLSSQVVSLGGPGRGVDKPCQVSELTVSTVAPSPYTPVRIIGEVNDGLYHHLVNRMVLKFMPSSRFAKVGVANVGLHPLDVSRQSLVFDPSKYRISATTQSSAAKLYKTGIHAEQHRRHRF